jgi:hypothetical protein
MAQYRSKNHGRRSTLGPIGRFHFEFGGKSMMDMTSLAEGLAIFKSGMDGIRAAYTFIKDVRGGLPADRQAELGKVLELSEQQFAIAEAQIAKGLGYELCHCGFPPLRC